jgi:uncharacterized RDD family membrane protein YckC
MNDNNDEDKTWEFTISDKKSSSKPEEVSPQDKSAKDKSKTWEFSLKEKTKELKKPPKRKRGPKEARTKVKNPSNVEVISEKAMKEARQGRKQGTLKFNINELKEAKSRSEYVEKEIVEEEYVIANSQKRMIAAVIDIVTVLFLFKVANFEKLIILAEDLYFPIVKIFNIEDLLENSQLDLLFISFNTLIFVFLFYLVPTIVMKRSLGKKILGIKIYCLITETPTFLTMILREVILKPFSIILVFGIAMIYFDEEKRAFHDRLSATLVVKE